MTCIAALISDGRIWMGGDSAGVSGYSLETRKDSKVFRKGDFLFGFTSSFRMGQLLGYKFVPPDCPEGMNPYDYMVVKFVDALRDTFSRAGFMKKENEVESGGTFLIGYRGRIFKIYDDYQVAESIYPFNACGCGEDIALGAMYARWNGIMGATAFNHPEQTLKIALHAAERFSSGVRGPFNVFMGENDDDLIGKDYRV